MAAVTFDGVAKVYPDGTRAVNHFDLDIKDGEFMVLVGPSGCGKTTALRMLAGLEDISEGVVKIGERVVNHVPSRDRDIAMVFQSYALYPHLSVYENIAFGLRVKKVPKAEIDARVKDAARILDLEQLLQSKPRNLSGGQRQRVAMGRAIVRHPQAFLMDEPLSNLDAKLRVQTRAEIAKLQHDLGVTTLYVTHDQVEALTMGDRVAVMKKGELQQVDDAQVLYDRPLNVFVAAFIGSPSMNLLEATLEKSGASYVRPPGHAVARAGRRGDLHARRRSRPTWASEIIVGIRPEDMEDPVLAGDAPKDRELKGKVELTEALGSEIMVHFSIDAAHAVTEDVADLQKDIGTDRAPGSGIASEGAGAVLVGSLRPALAGQGRRHDPGRRGYALTSLFRSPDVTRDLRLILPKGDHVSRLRISLLVLGAAIVVADRAGRDGRRHLPQEVRGERQSVVGRHLERRRAEELPESARRLPEEEPRREGQVHVGRRQRPDGALDRGRRRQPARPRLDRPARPRQAVRRLARRSSRSTSSGRRC